VTVLTKLTQVPWIRENQQLLNILNNLLNLSQARPPIIAVHEFGVATERIMGAAELEIQNGAPKAEVCLKYMRELIPNSGEWNVSKRVGSFAEGMVQRLPSNPGAADMQTIVSVREANNLIQTKGIQELEVADEHSVVDIISDLGVPAGKTQVHHTAPQHIIDRLRQLGYSNLDIHGCPAMVLDQIDHTGIQPYTATAIHNEMNAWKSGVLRWDNVQNNNDAEQLVNEMILFYKNKAPGWEKAMRGWANVNGLPHTE